jgi:hypothetical protein
MAKTQLNWSNITRADMSENSAELLGKFLEAKSALEASLAQDAVAAGAANEGDTFAFSYRSIGQGQVGMAIAERKAQSSGFGGLRKPQGETRNLADYQRQQDRSGYRR